MNKKEALVALSRGEKITHRYFTPDEWMKSTGSLYEFEDGCCCTPIEFWSTRGDDYWNTDWSVFNER